jgi:hypothetical protein
MSGPTPRGYKSEEGERDSIRRRAFLVNVRDAVATLVGQKARRMAQRMVELYSKGVLLFRALSSMHFEVCQFAPNRYWKEARLERDLATVCMHVADLQLKGFSDPRKALNASQGRWRSSLHERLFPIGASGPPRLPRCRFIGHGGKIDCSGQLASAIRRYE